MTGPLPSCLTQLVVSDTVIAAASRCCKLLLLLWWQRQAIVVIDHCYYRMFSITAEQQETGKPQTHTHTRWAQCQEKVMKNETWHTHSDSLHMLCSCGCTLDADFHLYAGERHISDRVAGLNKVYEYHCSLYHQRIMATAKGQWVLNQSQLDLVPEREWQIDPQALIFSIKTRKSAWKPKQLWERQKPVVNLVTSSDFVFFKMPGIKSVTDVTQSAVAIWFLRRGYSSQICLVQEV